MTGLEGGVQEKGGGGAWGMVATVLVGRLREDARGVAAGVRAKRRGT